MTIRNIFLGSIILMIIIILLIGIFNKLSVNEEQQLLEDIEKTIEKHQEEIHEIQEKNTDDPDKEEEETFVPKPVKEFFSETIHFAVEMFQHKEIRITAIGDSLTQGIGDETDQGGYVGIIQDALHSNQKNPTVIIDSFGKRGQRTGQLLTRLHDESEQELDESIELADIILITIGANDIMEIFKQNILNLTLEPFLDEQPRYEQRLRDIVNTITHKNENAKVFLLGFYNPFTQYFQHIEELDIIVDDWNDINQQVAESFDHGNFIPVKNLFKPSDAHLFADDHFHPNRAGYERIAKRVLQYLADDER